MILPSRHVSPSPLASLLFAGTGIEPQALGTFVSLLTQQQELPGGSEQPGHEPTFFLMPPASSETLLEHQAALSQESGETQPLLPGKNPEEEQEQQALYSILHSLQDLLQHLPADVSPALAPAQIRPATTADKSVAVNGEGLRLPSLQKPLTLGPPPMPLTDSAAGKAAGSAIPVPQREAQGIQSEVEAVRLVGADGTPLAEPGLLPGRMFTIDKPGGPAAGLQETVRSRGEGVQFQPVSSPQYVSSFPEYASDQPQQFLGEGRRKGQTPVATPLESPVPLDSEMVAQLSARVVDTDAAPVRSATPTLMAVERAPQSLQRDRQFAMETAGGPAGHLLPRHTILLQLDPPELGAMQIRVRLTHEHLAASFWADSPEVRALIQSHFPALNQSLSAQGFHGHQISMSLATGEFSGQAGQFAQQHAALPPAAYTKDPGGLGRRSSALSTERPTQRRYGRPGSVDVVI